MLACRPARRASGSGAGDLEIYVAAGRWQGRDDSGKLPSKLVLSALRRVGGLTDASSQNQLQFGRTEELK